MGASFLIQRETDASIEVTLAPDDADLQVIAYSRASSEMRISITDATTWRIVEEEGKQILVVGGSATGIREVTIRLNPVSIEVQFDL